MITHVPVFPDRGTLDLFIISREVPKSESIALGLKAQRHERIELVHRQQKLTSACLRPKSGARSQV